MVASGHLVETPGGVPVSDWHGQRGREDLMLNMALLFLVLALIAGVLGFSGIAGASANIAWILFLIFLVLMVVSYAANALRGRPPL